MIELSSLYLRHEFYGRLCVNNKENIFVSARYALGGEVETKPKCPTDDPILLCFGLRVIIQKISELMLPLVSENDALVKEVKSFQQFATVVDK